MGYQWVAVSMLTGQLICDLNGLICQSPQQTVGQYETCTAALPLPSAPAGWQQACTPGASVIWLLADTPNGSTVPVWGGYVTSAQLDHTDQVSLTLATLEAYLDQRYTGTRTYTSEDQNTICADLIAQCVASGPQGGLPITTSIVGAAGVLQSVAYQDQQDTTIYAALQALTALENGPEWCITGKWLHNPERIVPVFNVGTRLGAAALPGLAPSVVFEMPGSLAGFATNRSFAQGQGANSVMAYSSGQGTVRPQSPVQNQPDPGRPTFEYRWAPSQNTLNMTQLTQWAKSALGILAVGSVNMTAAVKVDQPGTPQYGVDWQLGDDIGYKIGGPSVYRDRFEAPFEDEFGVTDRTLLVPAFPSGLSGVARAIGFTYTVGDTMSMKVILAGGTLQQFDVEQNLQLFYNQATLTVGALG